MLKITYTSSQLLQKNILLHHTYTSFVGVCMVEQNIKTKGNKTCSFIRKWFLESVTQQQASSNSLLLSISWQDKANVLQSLQFQMYISYIYSCFSPCLHLRISALHPLSSTRLRQKLISPDICFQSKASSLLFPLCRLSIKRINLCAGKDHKRISLCLFSVSDSALSFFLTGCMCLSFYLYVSCLRWFTLSTTIQLCLILLRYFVVVHTALQKVVGVCRLTLTSHCIGSWVASPILVGYLESAASHTQWIGVDFFHQSVDVQWASTMSPQSLYPSHLLFACFCTFFFTLSSLLEVDWCRSCCICSTAAKAHYDTFQQDT